MNNRYMLLGIFVSKDAAESASASWGSATGACVDRILSKIKNFEICDRCRLRAKSDYLAVKSGT